jgi:hypothetical protein
MVIPRRQPPFWRRQTPSREYDIELLRPAGLGRGKRFETFGSKELADFLAECRAGDYECNKPFCPICARVFRRWFIDDCRVGRGPTSATLAIESGAASIALDIHLEDG